MKAYHGTAVLKFDDDTTGNAASGALVTIRINSSQSQASIFDVDDVAMGNPLTADSNGNYSFKAADNIYDIIISEGTPNEVKLLKVEVFDIPENLRTFSTLQSMLDSTSTFIPGFLLKTTVNNTDTNMGGAEYRIRTAAEYTAESPNPTPDGALIGGVLAGSDWYLNGGTDLVAQRIQEGPNVDVYEFGYRGIGVIDNGPTTKATPDATKDESDVLDKVYAYIERGASQDIGASSAGIVEFIQKGRYGVEFPQRSICNISRPLPYFINRCNTFFNNTDVRPITPFVVLSSFSFNNVVSQLLINYEIFNTDEEIYEAHLAGTDANGIEIMEFGEATIAFPLESFSHYDQCVITGGWQGIQGAKEGILFGIHFDNCRAVNPLSWGFNLGANDQISTTCLITQPFVRLTKRDTVQHNGFVWRALQHQGASEADQEPPAAAVSSEYWQIGLDGSGNPETPTTQTAWVGSTFYRAFGKHYRLINQSTLTLINPSADGGTDQAPTTEFSGINLSIDHFHLEKHQKVFSDRPTFSVISGALTFGTLYLAECLITNEGNSTVQNGGEVFSCRVAHTSTADNEPLTGPNWFDYWDKISVSPVLEPAWALTSDYKTGDATFFKAANVGGRGISIDNLEQKSTVLKSGRVKAIDGENTNDGRAYTGKGISQGLTKNMGGQISQRGFVTPRTNVVQLLSLVTVFTYRPRAEQNGSVFSTSLVEAGVLTVEIDGTLPQGTKFGFYVSETSGGISNPAGTINLTGVNDAFFVGPATVKGGTIWVEKTGTSINSANSWRTWTEGATDTDGFVEIIPAGSYTSGDYSLPTGKTFADITKIKVMTKVGDTVSQYEIDTSLIPSQTQAFGFRESGSNAVVFPLAFSSTSTALRVNGTGAQVLYCSVKF